jgi:two-component system chemotaxis sensor kinase CheA
MTRYLQRVVMVVDDDSELRAAMTDALQTLGYDVIPCANGADALNKLHRGTPPHVIVLDLNMPVMDGYVFRAIQRGLDGYRDIPVILLAGELPDGRPPDVHAACVLRKPFRIDAMLAEVEHSALPATVSA